MNTKDILLGGQWEIALIMIIIVSWILYKYIVPENYKEWRNAGLVQAFIIALYAEMYGFPLTIYILTSFLGIDIAWLHIRGHLWGTLLGFGDSGAMIEMFLGYSIIFTGLILISKGWFLIYKAQPKGELVTSGIYQYIRHPQYTGLFIALFGQLVHWPTIITLVLFSIIICAYYRLSLKEEKAMLLKYGEVYRKYQQEVPMFFSKLSHWRLLFFGEDKSM